MKCIYLIVIFLDLCRWCMKCLLLNLMRGVAPSLAILGNFSVLIHALSLLALSLLPLLYMLCWTAKRSCYIRVHILNNDIRIVKSQISKFTFLTLQSIIEEEKFEQVLVGWSIDTCTTWLHEILLCMWLELLVLLVISMICTRRLITIRVKVKIVISNLKSKFLIAYATLVS